METKRWDECDNDGDRVDELGEKEDGGSRKFISREWREFCREIMWLPYLRLGLGNEVEKTLPEDQS